MDPATDTKSEVSSATGGQKALDPHEGQALRQLRSGFFRRFFAGEKAAKPRPCSGPPPLPQVSASTCAVWKAAQSLARLPDHDNHQ
ncbi:MAG TPA: hypothetical protein PK926_10965 [Spirochaetota bacterium]|nr:hypothetical protein [Spirochaetota bacterium]HPI88429.1 hypothetical protein [Spirochaetota bacterium]